MAMTREHLEAYRRYGFVFVPDLFTREAMDAALDACDRIFYGGKRFEEWRDAFDGSGDPVRDGFFSNDASGRSQFPVGHDALDRLIENEAFLDAFCACLGTDDPHYCNAHLFVRAGPTDKRHAPNPWEGYHIDHDTNSFLPPSGRIGHDDYVNCGVYLHDVEPDGAPMHVIPGSHRQIVEILPRLISEGIYRPPTTITDIRLVPEFAAPVPSVAKAGTALFYSSYLVHAAVPFQDKTRQRALWTLSMARSDTRAYNRFANAYAYGDRTFTVPFWKNTTARVRTLFGWPPPGDPYYTPETLSLLASWYPGIDLDVYRSAREG